MSIVWCRDDIVVVYKACR